MSASILMSCTHHCIRHPRLIWCSRGMNEDTTVVYVTTEGELNCRKKSRLHVNAYNHRVWTQNNL